MKAMLTRVAFVVAAIAASTAMLAAQEWTPAGTRRGVELAFRDDAALGVRQMRAVGEIPYSASRIVAIACDFTQTLDPDVRESRIMSGDLKSGYEIYLRYASRFVVVAGRDVVISVQHEPNGCSWSERSGVAPERSGTVRMPLLRGSWLVETLDASRSRVTYHVAVKPGGSIPGWLVRRGAAGALPNVFERLTQCLAATAAGRERC